jgi:uncharacterized protein (DUF1778 family)
MAAAKSIRLSLRVPLKANALIEQAAALAGVSTPQFIEQSARAAAQRVLGENDTIQLLPMDFEAFVAACEDPQIPTIPAQSWPSLM